MSDPSTSSSPVIDTFDDKPPTSSSSPANASTPAFARDMDDATFETGFDVIHASLTASTPVAKQHQALVKFTLFPQLPMELRLMVWGMALTQPRVISVLCGWDENQKSMSGWAYTQKTLRRPILGWVCREACEKELKLKIEQPEQPLINYPAVDNPGTNIFTVPESDVVLLLDEHKDCEFGLMQTLEDLVSDSIPYPTMKTIALHYKWQALVLFDQHTIEENMDIFNRLGTKEVVFVVGQEYKCHARKVSLITPTREPEQMLEPSHIQFVRHELMMDCRQRLTWADVEWIDTLKLQEAKEVIGSGMHYLVSKVSYREAVFG